MGDVSVAEAAERLGVGVARVHQRIADGSLRAERIGSQWVIDEVSLSPLLESRRPGRPLSERSARALLALSEGNRRVLDALAPAERSRARDRLRGLLANSMSEDALPEVEAHPAVSLLRSWLRNRAERRLFRASPRDLPDLRDDARIALSGLSHPRSGIASGDLVEGYVAAGDIDPVVNDYVLSSVAADKDSNVVLHVASAVLADNIGHISALLLAADLAEHRRPREEARAVALLRQIVKQNPGLISIGEEGRGDRREARA